MKTIDIKQAVGKPHVLWITFAKFYEQHGDLQNSCEVFRRATQQLFKSIEDLASVWCEWVELELNHKNYKQALSLCREALKEKVFACFLYWTRGFRELFQEVIEAQCPTENLTITFREEYL